MPLEIQTCFSCSYKTPVNNPWLHSCKKIKEKNATRKTFILKEKNIMEIKKS